MSDKQSANNKTPNQEQTWNEYQQALNVWKNSFESLKKAGEEALEKYISAINESSKQSNSDLMKKFNEAWAKTWDEIFEQSSTWYFKTWKKIWKESNFISYNAFNEYWQNRWKGSIDNVFIQFKETLDKLGKDWQQNKES